MNLQYCPQRDVPSINKTKKESATLQKYDPVSRRMIQLNNPPCTVSVTQKTIPRCVPIPGKCLDILANGESSITLTFTKSGTYDLPFPGYLTVTCSGGGGGGAGGNSFNGSYAGGGGGGSGYLSTYSFGFLRSGSMIYYTIGYGGSGGSVSAAGGPGGTTTLSIVGQPTVTALGGTGGNPGTTDAHVGLGGAGFVNGGNGSYGGTLPQAGGLGGIGGGSSGGNGGAAASTPGLAGLAGYVTITLAAPA